jgi:hypothetical protein
MKMVFRPDVIVDDPIDGIGREGFKGNGLLATHVGSVARRERESKRGE